MKNLTILAAAAVLALTATACDQRQPQTRYVSTAPTVVAVPYYTSAGYYDYDSGRRYSTADYNRLSASERARIESRARAQGRREGRAQARAAQVRPASQPVRPVATVQRQPQRSSALNLSKPAPNRATSRPSSRPSSYSSRPSSSRSYSSSRSSSSRSSNRR